jgi:hypothetical protein
MNISQATRQGYDVRRFRSGEPYIACAGGFIKRENGKWCGYLGVYTQAAARLRNVNPDIIEECGGLVVATFERLDDALTLCDAKRAGEIVDPGFYQRVRRYHNDTRAGRILMGEGGER